VFLFIFESIGTSELLLIGIVALIFLGPRKMPEMARKIGKMMAEFRTTTNEFKETWQREANIDEEIKALRFDDEPGPEPVSRQTLESAAEPSPPAIKPADPSSFKELPSKAGSEPVPLVSDLNDKTNWL
jgi:Tat protein translocase TatB subunit